MATEHLDQTSISVRIRARREALGLTQRQLAERAEISQQSLSLYENGRIPRAPQWVRLAMALEMTVLELLSGRPTEDLSGGRADRKRELHERAQHSMTQAGKATVWQVVSIPESLHRDGRLIKAVRELLDILRGPDKNEVQSALGAIEIFAERARDQRRKRGPRD